MTYNNIIIIIRHVLFEQKLTLRTFSHKIKTILFFIMKIKFICQNIHKFIFEAVLA